MKPIGPASEMAAPVAIDALRNAMRCARGDVHAACRRRVFAQCEQVERPRQHREHRERRAHERHRREDWSEAADVEVAEQPARSAIPVGEVHQILHERDQRREKRVERDAGQQEHVGGQHTIHARGQPVNHRRPEERSGEAGGWHCGPAHHAVVEVERDREHRAERGAGRDPECKWCGQRIAQQRLQHDARGSKRRPDQRAGEHARQPGDEEDLRVDVVRPRHRGIEHACQRDRRAPERRSDQQHDERDRSERQEQQAESRSYHRDSRAIGTTTS